MLTGSFHAQGPIDGFMKEKGELDLAIGMGFNNSKTFYGGFQKTYDLPYRSESLNIFAQLGFTDRINGIIQIPFIFGRTEDKFQDLGIYLKTQALSIDIGKSSTWSHIISTGYSFPASNYMPDVIGAIGQRAKWIPLLYVTQLKFENGLFINFTGGYHFRLDELSEETKIMLKNENSPLTTMSPPNRYTLMGRIGLAKRHHFFEFFAEYQKTLGGINHQEGVFLPVKLYGVDYLKLGGTYYYGLSENGIAVNLSYIPALRRNIGDFLSVGISFIIKHKLNK
ncbi:MAG: hypothetical protein R3277_13135 [Brumimicrobium sp.]|nr:hypothetical protein [Brumimicrobium sp.]